MRIQPVKNCTVSKHESIEIHWYKDIKMQWYKHIEIHWYKDIEWENTQMNVRERSAMDFLSKYRISFLKKMMDRWSVNEVVWVVISGQSANQSVSNLIWLLVCQSCSQPLRNHPAPWHHSDQAVHKKYKKTQIQKYKIQNKYSLWGNTLPHGTAVWTLLSSAAHQNKKEMSKYEIQKR